MSRRRKKRFFFEILKKLQKVPLPKFFEVVLLISSYCKLIIMTHQARLPSDPLSNPFAPSLLPQSDYLPYNYHNNYVNSPTISRKQPNLSNSRGVQRINDSINLNENHSFARNYKARLYNIDPKDEQQKHNAQDKYRQALRIQMEDDKRRKAKQKAKEEEQDLRHERKFYQNARIQAQQKANKKEQPNYFVMRTAKGRRKDKDDSGDEGKLGRSAILDGGRTDVIVKRDMLQRTIYQPPRIIKRGGYHNQSSLDQTKDYPVAPNPQDKAFPGISTPATPKYNRTAAPPLIVNMTGDVLIKQEMAEQQDRISKLLIFQQNMMKKLDYFKKEIYNTDRTLKLTQQFQKIKLKLRAKTLNLHKIHSLAPSQGLDDVLQNSDMYELPIISKKRKMYEGDRQAKKKKKNSKYSTSQDYTQLPKKQLLHLQDNHIRQNDKNTRLDPEQQYPLQNPQPIPEGSQYDNENQVAEVQAQF